MPVMSTDTNTTTAPVSDSLQSGAQFEESALREMAEAGVFYGRKKRVTHPRMKPFIFATRNNVEIIDLEKTITHLERAKSFLNDIMARKGRILFVATQPSAREPMRALAEKFGMSYVVHRWLGGTLTNFKTINARINYFKNLREEEATGALQKYTKKERVKFNKEIGRMRTLFGGLEVLTQLPDVLFVINADLHETAVREARRMNIPVVALISTNQDPDCVGYPIPGNDTAPASIKWTLDTISKDLEKAKLSQPTVNNPQA